MQKDWSVIQQTPLNQLLGATRSRIISEVRIEHYMTDTSQIIPTDASLAGDAHVTSADGNAAVSPDSLTLSELNQMLGKNFPDKATALKSVGDTFKFVGKRTEDIKRELAGLTGETIQDATTTTATSTGDSALVKTLKNDMFYLSNPQYKDQRALIESLSGATGDPAEVVAGKVFKDIFEKIQAADTISGSRSVVSSNNRIGTDTTVITEAVAAANAGSKTDAADILAKNIREQMGN